MTVPQTFRAILDEHGNAVQALVPTGTPANFSISTVSARVALPAGGIAYRLAATADCYIAFGNSAVTASTASNLFPAGAEIWFDDSGATHLAAITVTGNAVFGVTAMKGGG